MSSSTRSELDAALAAYGRIARCLEDAMQMYGDHDGWRYALAMTRSWINDADTDAAFDRMIDRVFIAPSVEEAA